MTWLVQSETHNNGRYPTWKIKFKMYYVLKCECGRELTVTRKQAGQALLCECGQRVTVPTLRGLSALPPAAAPAPTGGARPISREEQARSVWSGWRGPAIALACAVFVVSGIATARFLYHRYSLDTSYTIETEVIAGNELFDLTTPEDLSLAWSDYQKLHLGPKDRPFFYRVSKFARDREISAAVSGTICLLSGLAALGVWFSARRKK